MNLSIDFMRHLGPIKPVHGVGQPPVRWSSTAMFHYLEEAAIPYARLHDVGGPYGQNRFVDIPNLFRDFDADPADPESYDFAFTDLVVSALITHHVEPVFRLGVSIENDCTIKAYRIDPPKDFYKWAQICEGVIRHYTQGWANGFTYDIQYWEIWNEPDINPDPQRSMMWRGTPGQFYEFYHTAATYLKEKFPHLKIGGYGSCGFYAMPGTLTPSVTDQMRYHLAFFDGFMDYICAHGTPLDFFSWHCYHSAPEVVQFAAYVRKRLDEAGYMHTEHMLNEWNWEASTIGTAHHAALTAGMLLAMQGTSLDSAMFYDARCNIGTYSGMFNCFTTQPHPAYYAFVAFGELYRRGQEVVLTGLPEGVYACAARDDESGCIVIANTTGKAQPLTLDVQGMREVTACRIVDEAHAYTECALPDILPAESFVCILYK